MRHRYGIGQPEYEQLLDEQGGVCAICGGSCSAKQHLSVDHCHATRRVRGLLCHHCNMVLGYAHDDISILARAIEYLNEE